MIFFKIAVGICIEAQIRELGVFMDRRSDNRKLAVERRTGYRSLKETKKRIFKSRISKAILILGILAGVYAVISTFEITFFTKS